ncbi:MAG: bifunctional serine/threonine-protein kinase/formylglycine-generating enzyme family protein [Planctomycetaceae bacterium]
MPNQNQPDNDPTLQDDRLDSDDAPTVDENPDEGTLVEPKQPPADDAPTLVEHNDDTRTAVDQPVASADPDATAFDSQLQDGRTVVEPTTHDRTAIEPGSVHKDENATVNDNAPHDDQATIVSQNTDDDSNTFISGSLPGETPAPASAIRTLDRFELVRVLGQGAFGTVYLGRDPRLDRQVAIKVAKTGVLNSKSDIDRFNRESRAAAQLRHPNIVPVYEAGQIKGSSYIVHDFIEGQTLKQLLKKSGQLPPADAVRTMIQIARALDYAHSQGIIHRDIKPENILIDKAGNPHIADFGLARNEEKDATRTREGTLMGTPAYMSPEQASGKVSQVDRRSDVWSLGIMLDEMLTARRIFSGTVVEVLTAVQSEPIKPLRSVDASLPIDLETICLKALEKDQNTRFQTAGDFANELELWTNGEPITLRRIGYGERLIRWAKRNQTVAALLATVFFTLILGTAVSTWFGYDASQKAAALELEKQERVIDFMKAVLKAEPEAVPELLDGVDDFETETDLLSQLQKIEANPDERETRRPLMVTHLSDNPSEKAKALDQLQTALLQEEPREVLMLRQELWPQKDQLTPGLWKTAEDTNARNDTRLRAAAALALYDPRSPKWIEITDAIVSQLLADSLNVASWSRAFSGVKDRLRPSLERVYLNPDESNKKAAASVLTSLFANSPDVLLRLVDSADASQLGVLVQQLRRHPEAIEAISNRLARKYPDSLLSDAQEVEDQQRANNVIALLQSGQLDTANQELKRPDRNGVRSHVIDRAADARLNQGTLFRTLLEESHPALLRTTMLALADYSESDIDKRTRNDRKNDLLRLYRNHPDSGVHGAIEYLMRKWGLEEELAEAAKELQSPDWPTDGRNWHHSPSGIVFAIIRNPPEFLMGTDDPIRGNPLPEEETPHPRKIGRSYAISLYEVTIDQFLAFDAAYKPKYRPWSGDSPASSINWYRAATFCNWLSTNEELGDKQLCYRKPTKQAVNAFPDVVNRQGYRLPTRAEWEYAARAGTVSLRHFGSGDQLLDSYAWMAETVISPQACGQLLPNEFGLFDSLGNVREWLQTWASRANPAGENFVDGDEGKPGQFSFREHAGASYVEIARDVIEAARVDAAMNPVFKQSWLGFRVARTLPQNHE